MTELTVRIISQKGTCAAGHKVGDEFVIGQETPPGLCPWAFHSLFPAIAVLQFGGSFPWESEPDRATAACPDAENPVVFELQRSSSE